MKPSFIESQIGNASLLDLPLTAFFCSRTVSSEAVLRCYDWAIEMRNSESCVISGFHSPIEQDVLHFLLKGKQPVVMALARGMKTQWGPPVQKALEENRLLIITPLKQSIKRASSYTTSLRNELMIQLSDKIVVGYLNPEGSLAKTLQKVQNIKILFPLP